MIYNISPRWEEDRKLTMVVGPWFEDLHCDTTLEYNFHCETRMECFREERMVEYHMQLKNDEFIKKERMIKYHHHLVIIIYNLPSPQREWWRTSSKEEDDGIPPPEGDDDELSSPYGENEEIPHPERKNHGITPPVVDYDWAMSMSPAREDDMYIFNTLPPVGKVEWNIYSKKWWYNSSRWYWKFHLPKLFWWISLERDDDVIPST